MSILLSPGRNRADTGQVVLALKHCRSHTRVETILASLRFKDVAEEGDSD